MEGEIVVKKLGLRDLLKCKNFTVLLAASFISRFGDALDSIAYGWMVYMLTGSKLMLGTLFAVNALPNIILGPFTGVLADRLNKKKLIILSYLGRGLVVSLTALLYMVKLLEPWHLFVFTIINSTLETLMSPAVVSIMPLIIRKDLFLSANSFSASVNKFSELVGTGMAGAVIALLGISGAIFIDGATFFMAAVLIMLMRVKIPVIDKVKLNVKTYMDDLKVGFSFVKNTKLIKLSIGLFALVNFCIAPINVLMPIFAKDILKGGPDILSYIGVAFAVGTIIGGIMVGQFGSRFKISTLTIVGLFFFGVAYDFLALPGTIVSGGIYSSFIAVVVFLVFGLLIPIINSPIQAYLMTNTEREVLGRVISFMTMITCSAIPLGSALTGTVSEYVPIWVIFISMGIIISAAGLLLFFNKDFRKE
jgi:DHA3 family macrolide efflux protein-like MFS transporter